MKVYPAVIHEEEGFWIEFPDLEGCQTCGDTLEETLEFAQEALGLYLASLIENDQKIPKASKIEQIRADKGEKTYIYRCQQVSPGYKSCKKMLSIPAWLAKQAEKDNLSLSKVL